MSAKEHVHVVSIFYDMHDSVAIYSYYNYINFFYIIVAIHMHSDQFNVKHHYT